MHPGAPRPANIGTELLGQDTRFRLPDRQAGDARPIVSPRTVAVGVTLGVMHALIFDLDGTLVDTVYAHVFAWQRALDEAGMAIEGWRIHRRIGMSGGLFTRAVAREVGHPLTDEQAMTLQRRHGELFRQRLPERRPLP